VTAIKILRSIKRIQEIFTFKTEREDFDSVHQAVEKGISFKGANLWILICAILIASLGLNVNSTAVIIGAMLISPLMGPITGIGFGLAVNDLVLVSRSLRNFFVAVITALLTSTLYFSLSPIYEAHSELLARTQPNLYDVLIALFGGLAGVIALNSKQKGQVLPGVAIATALMPPLCTAGYGLATLQWNFFFGAFYLFLINTVFISWATLITTSLLKYPHRNPANVKIRTRAQQLVATIVTLTLLPSIYFGYRLVVEERFKSIAEKFIRDDSHVEGDYLLNQSIDPVKKTITLTYGGRQISREESLLLEQKLKKYYLKDASLLIRQGFKSEEISEEIIKGIQDKSLQAQEEYKLTDTQRADSLDERLFAELKVLYPDLKALICTPVNKITLEPDSISSGWLVWLSFNINPDQVSANEIKRLIPVRLNSNRVEIVIHHSPSD
jgi:uncharacterized hydrophobic protein (TIGR00271 family)